MKYFDPCVVGCRTRPTPLFPCLKAIAYILTIAPRRDLFPLDFLGRVVEDRGDGRDTRFVQTPTL